MEVIKYVVKDGNHYGGSGWHRGIQDARLFKTEAHARASAEVKHWGYIPMKVKVTIEEIA